MSFEHSVSAVASSTSAVLPAAVTGRCLLPEELRLLEALLSRDASLVSLRTGLSERRVAEMQDGGMGSLRFVGGPQQKMGREVLAARAMDSDGVPLEISVNVDEQGDLFELDIWKVDYTPLVRFPDPAIVPVA